MNTNTLLATDVYKVGHKNQYHPDTTEVYSYLEARKPGQKVLWWGLQYYLKEYLVNRIAPMHVEEFLEYHQAILPDVELTPQDIHQFGELGELGYWPVEIKSAPEGLIIPTGNALMTIKNTDPRFYWCVGFLESLLLKVWYPSTVATASRKYYELVKYYGEVTCDDLNHLPFAVHDFSYRGTSAEESAAIAGASHLLSFRGSDTITANWFARTYYSPTSKLGLSVPASEHSVMCSYGRGGEFEAFDHMLDLYPKGIVSIVADTYDYWDILKAYLPSRKERIMAREGKVVVRPDSGNQVDIICGTHTPLMTPESLGSLEMLWHHFGGTTNSKGYRVLDPHVGLIYGDGFVYDKFEQVLARMKELGFASSNLVIGVGGILAQQRTRDELGFALKASRAVRQNGNIIEIFKDPLTDPGKRSKKGLMNLCTAQHDNGGMIYCTTDQCTEEDETKGILETVFRNGEITKTYSFDEVQANAGGVV